VSPSVQIAVCDVGVCTGPIAGTAATQQAQVIGKVPDVSTGYHNFWVTHLPDKITFGVDDVTLGTLTPELLAPGSTWVYNRPMQVILNLAVGGPLVGRPEQIDQVPRQDVRRLDPVGPGHHGVTGGTDTEL
jgi:beta-glucanase (GH16 family)